MLTFNRIAIRSGIYGLTLMLTVSDTLRILSLAIGSHIMESSDKARGRHHQ